MLMKQRIKEVVPAVVSAFSCGAAGVCAVQMMSLQVVQSC
jgi:hypothetical protein